MIDEPPARRDHGGDHGAGRTRAGGLLNRLALGLCVLAMVAALAAWFQTRAWYHLLSAAGFACMAFVVRRMPLAFSSKVWPLPEDWPAVSRADAVVQWIGWGLIIAALASHWFG